MCTPKKGVRTGFLDTILEKQKIENTIGDANDNGIDYENDYL